MVLASIRRSGYQSFLVVVCLAIIVVGSAATTVTLHATWQQRELVVKADDYAFIPAFVTVSVGTAVMWTNLDLELHTVTGDDGVFDGSIGPNETFTFVFREPGVFFYTCQPHDWMIGEITVVADSPSERSLQPTPAPPSPARVDSVVSGGG